MTNTKQMSDKPIYADMVADAKLNRDVAEKVMGWRKLAQNYITINGWGGYDPARPREGVRPVPAYSTDLSAAFQLVEHLRAKWLKEDPEETIFFEFLDCCEHGWYVSINWGHHDIDILLAEARNQSLPRAIALASLQAVEGR